MTEEGLYISPQLKTDINSINYYIYKTEYRFCDINIQVELYKTLGYSKKKIELILLVINFMVYVCKAVKSNYKDNINIKIVLSPFKKTVDTEDVTLTSYNVNSGFTVRDYSRGKSDIIIYREEEVIKVLIHELIHAFDMDTKIVPNTDYMFEEMFKKETKIDINESFTDTYACLINVCIVSVYISRKYNVNLNDIFERLLESEREHILYMGGKIVELHSKNTREETHVTSYYILKAVNWYKLEEFSKYIIKNDYTIGSYRGYAVFLGKQMNNNYSNLHNMNVKHIKYNNEKGNKHQDKFIKNIKIKIKDKSIRMSSIDILNIYQNV
jgi:hypothetical protein